MKTASFVSCLTFLFFAVSVSNAQVVFEGDSLSIRFDAWAGIGFTPEGLEGRLSSKSWVVRGLTDGSMDFGDTRQGGDFGRGVSSGRVTTGGVYAFAPEAGVRLLGFQPTGSDLAPGSATLRIRIPGALMQQRIDVSYDLWVYNDQDRSTVIELEWSKDGMTYWSVTDGSTLTPAAAVAGVAWRKHTVQGTFLVDEVAADSTLYLRWNMKDGTGTGSRDEWGLEEIRLSLGDFDTDEPPPTARTLLKLDFNSDTDIPSPRDIDQFDAYIGLVHATRAGFSTGSPGRAANANGWTQGNGAWFIRFSTVGYRDLAVQSKQYSSPAGPRNFSIEWSSDSLLWNTLSTLEVANAFVGVLPNRGLHLPKEAENRAKVWFRWRQVDRKSVDGGETSFSGTSRIDEIEVTGIQTDPVAPIMSALQLKPDGNTIKGYLEVSSHGSALISDLRVKCAQQDGDSLLVDSIPVAVRRRITYQSGTLPRPSSWSCLAEAQSASGSIATGPVEVRLDPPPPPHASKPTVQSRNIKIVARTDTTMQIQWEKGNGEYAIVVLVPDGVSSCQTDTLATYLSDQESPSSARTKNGCLVKWSGAGNKATLRGFEPLERGIITVLEYNGVPGRENYLEADQEQQPYQTRARTPGAVVGFAPQLVTEDRVVLGWNPPRLGQVRLVLASEKPEPTAIYDYLDGKGADGHFREIPCGEIQCTIDRIEIGAMTVFAFVVHGPAGHQSIQGEEIATWEPVWPDSSLGRLLVEWDFDLSEQTPSRNIWEHQGVEFAVVGARNRGFAQGSQGLALYADQWNEPAKAPSWVTNLTTHGLESTVLEAKIISSASGPSVYKLVCEVAGELYTGTEDIHAAAAWAGLTPQRVAVPNPCLNQPMIKVSLTPATTIALNGNPISRSGTSRIDDVRLYGTYSKTPAPLMKDPVLLYNDDRGVALLGGWRSASGLLPSRQSLRLVAASEMDEIFYPVDSLSAYFRLPDLKSATTFQMEHCGYVEATKSCSKAVTFRTPYPVPQIPRLVGYHLLEPDAAVLVVDSPSEDIALFAALVGTPPPQVRDSSRIDPELFPGLHFVQRLSTRQDATLSKLRPGATYRVWIASVVGPDSLARFSKPPYAHIDIMVPKLDPPPMSNLVIKTHKIKYSAVEIDLGEVEEDTFIATLTPSHLQPSHPEDDVEYRYGNLYDDGDRIGAHTVVVGQVQQGVLRVKGLPHGTKWTIRIYGRRSLHGAVVYSTDYASHSFGTLPDPFIHSMTAPELWNKALGDTVTSSGTVLWNRGEAFILSVPGGNILVTSSDGSASNPHRGARAGVVGVRGSSGVQSIDVIVESSDGEWRGTPQVLHPDSSMAFAIRQDVVGLGNTVATGMTCPDGKSMLRQRGARSRKICLLNEELRPAAGDFPPEWAIVAHPLFNPDTSYLRLLVADARDIMPYNPPRAVLKAPNKDQIISWTNSDDVEVEFKWDVVPSSRPYDQYPDSLIYESIFATRPFKGSVEIEQRLSEHDRAISFGARDLHRRHSKPDSIAMSIDIEWTLALRPPSSGSLRDDRTADWTPFRLLKLVALKDTDIMDIPDDFRLDPPRPNPFNPTTSIRVHLPTAGTLTLVMYDALGRTVKRVYHGFTHAGVHDISVDAGRLSSGVYVLRAIHGSSVATRSVTLLK